MKNTEIKTKFPPSWSMSELSKRTGDLFLKQKENEEKVIYFMNINLSAIREPTFQVIMINSLVRP